MTDLPQVARLEQLLDRLPTNDGNDKDTGGRLHSRAFAQDLIRAYRRRGMLSANQLTWVERLTRRALGTERTSPSKGKKVVDPSKIGETRTIVEKIIEKGADIDADALVGDICNKVVSILEPKLPKIDGDAIVKQVLERVSPQIPRRVEVVLPSKQVIDLGDLVHCQFEEVLAFVSQHIHLCLVGPAGSGKTTLAKQLAKALGDIRFGLSGQMTGDHQLLGFVDGAGRYHTTAFRECFEKGGVWLGDEMDGSDPTVPQTLNSALANGWMTFPDSPAMIEMHKDFYCVAAANTYGRGADRVYVGRNQLDGAFTDRFAFLDFDYDEQLETRICGNATWAKRVQSLRAAAFAEKARITISPRASINGAKMLAQGKLSQKRIEDVVVWKGIDADLRRRIEQRAV